MWSTVMLKLVVWCSSIHSAFCAHALTKSITGAAAPPVQHAVLMPLFMPLQGLGRKRLLVLSTAFNGWHAQAQLQLYRRHVVRVVGRKVNNGLLLKAFNCWR